MYTAFRCPLPLFTVISQPTPPPEIGGSLLLRDGEPISLSTGENLSLTVEPIPENYLGFFGGGYLDLSDNSRITVWRIYEPLHFRNKTKFQLSTLATLDLIIPPVTSENNLTLSNGTSLSLSNQEKIDL